MPASLTRNEYFWERERLVCRQNRRSSIYSQWRLTGNESDLIVAIEDRRDSKKIVEGGAASPFRIAHALLRESRLTADPNARDIGVNIPESLVSQAAEIVRAAVAEVTRQYQQLANEERRTGAVSYELNKQQSIEHDGWELTVMLQGFSTQTKEPQIGADLGMVVDVKQGDKQVSKGVLIQAKNAGSLPDEPLTLEDMKEQMRDMLSRTEEAYGMIFTPDGIFVFRGWDSKEVTGLDSIIADIARCRRGDRRPELVAVAVDEEYTVELTFQNVMVPGSTKVRRLE